MKKIFSPWRSAYIKTFSEKKKKKQCLFCSIMKNKKNDRKNLIVWRGQYCFVVMNRFPYNSGHVMVVPYRHTALMEDFDDNEQLECMKVIQQCITALKAESHPEGFNVGANIGRVAGAGIDQHIHFHVVPRWNGDANFMPVLSDVKIVSESIEATRTGLANQFKRIFQQ
ncbi:MAG TPA: HIT domain-containing protein [Bacteroidota bacterium]|nr:HIT domain-containing protein [Bacteroidota bacterium]